MNASTKKLTTAAVCTALAVIMCVFTAYLPLSFMPLFVAAFCIFLACKRGSIYYGVLCAAASVGLMFLMTGLSVKWLVFVLMFAPYGIMASFIHRYDYFKVKRALIRAAIAIVFFNVTFGIVYVITINVLSVGIDGMNIAEWANIVGGYPVLAVIATLVLLPLDFIFSTMSIVILKKIPAPVTRIKPRSADNAAADTQSAADKKDGADGKVEYDIFGYEINGAQRSTDEASAPAARADGNADDGTEKDDDDRNRTE